MCDKYPGLRCSGHMQTNYIAKVKAYEAAYSSLNTLLKNESIALIEATTPTEEARIQIQYDALLYVEKAKYKTAQADLVFAKENYEATPYGYGEIHNEGAALIAEAASVSEIQRGVALCEQAAELKEKRVAAAAAYKTYLSEQSSPQPLPVRPLLGKQVSATTGDGENSAPTLTADNIDEFKDGKFLSQEKQDALFDFCDNPKASPDLLQRVYENSNLSRCNGLLASNTNTPPEVLDALAHTNDINQKARVARNRSFSTKTALFLAKSKSNTIYSALAENPSCPPHVLAKLVGRGDSRWSTADTYLAKNPNTPPAAIASFVKHKYPEVREAVMERPSLRDDLATHLATENGRVNKELHEVFKVTPLSYLLKLV